MRRNHKNGQQQKKQALVTLLLIVVILIFAGGAALVFSMNGITADSVTVTVDGERYGEYPLAVATTVRIETQEGYNVLEIRDGQARITEADCRSQVCVHTGGVSADGGRIVCLPHKLVVAVSRVKESGIDAVTNE